MNGEHWRDYFDSEYLGSWDLPRDRDCLVQIVKVRPGTLVGQRGKKDKKAILNFRGKEKSFAANVTNCKTIATLYGPNPHLWVGKWIALYVAENVDSPNGPVDAIRIRPTIPRAPVAAVKQRNGTETRPAPPEPEPEPISESSDEWTPEEPPHGALETDHEQP